MGLMAINSIRGQFTLITLMGIVLTIIVFLAIYPVVDAAIDDHISEYDTTTQLVLQLLPLLIVCMILFSGFYYMMPQRQVVYGGQGY